MDRDRATTINGKPAKQNEQTFTIRIVDCTVQIVGIAKLSKPPFLMYFGQSLTFIT